MYLSGKQKTAGALAAGYLLAIVFDPLVTVLRLNIENWAEAKGYGQIYTWPFLATIRLALVTVWEAFIGSWGFGFICGAVLIAYWEPVRSLFSEKSKQAVVIDEETAQPEKRIFLGKAVNIWFLVGLFDGRTALEGQEALKKYLGKWMRFIGVVNDVYSQQTGYSIFFKVPRESETHLHIHVWAYFRKLDDRIPIMRPGEVVELEGRLDRGDDYVIRLEDASLIQVGGELMPTGEVRWPEQAQGIAQGTQP